MKLILDLLRVFGVVLGLVWLKRGRHSSKPAVRWSDLGLGAILVSLGSLLNYWMLRPNRAHPPRGITIRTNPIVKDGWHNSNTDLIFWHGAYYLIHAASPFHFGNSRCHLKLWRSTDAQNWELIARFSAAPEDIRDPKFSSIGERLYLYVLLNRTFNPEPYTTAFTYSEDGENWMPIKPIQPGGWLFWRPKSQDGKTWYVPAYWWEHGESILLRSNDGENWQKVSTIYQGDRNDETDIEFLPDGRMIAVARLEFSEDFICGDPKGCTLIATSKPPYTNWKIGAKSPVTRLDGPCLFACNGKTYALGRFQPVRNRPFSYPGSIFSRKRTSLFLVEESRLVYLGDLPSAGDTSYGAVIQHNDELLIEYYTSSIHKDYPWIIGMLCPSEICMVRLSLQGFERWTELVAKQLK